jgi:1-acyl-sn-glycerol-3-phosphate acyltransferase
MNPVMKLLRSLAVQAAFYLTFAACALVFIPFLLAPRRWLWWALVTWSNALRGVIRLGGIRMEFRGLEHLPPGGCIIACKHQSALETISMLGLFRDPTYILKRELMWIPFFGWYASRAEMTPIDRARGSETLKRLVRSVRAAVAAGKQVVIYPEGTRRTVGAEPEYKGGIAVLYREAKVPVVPVALNTGLFWPRNTLWRHPGTAVVEILPPIPPGLSMSAFQARLVETIETGSDQLLLEAAGRADAPPLTAEAAARVAALRAAPVAAPPDSQKFD